MSQVTEYRLDLRPEGIPEPVHVSQGDTGWRNLTFRLFFDGEPFSVPAGTSAEIVGRKSDGSTFSEAMTTGTDTVSLAITGDMTDIYGCSMCRLQLRSGDLLLASGLFALMVEKPSITKPVVGLALVGYALTA